MVHGNFSARLYIVCVSFFQSIKIKQQIILSPEPGCRSKLTQVLRLTPVHFRCVVRCAVSSWPRHWNCHFWDNLCGVEWTCRTSGSWRCCLRPASHIMICYSCCAGTDNSVYMAQIATLWMKFKVTSRRILYFVRDVPLHHPHSLIKLLIVIWGLMFCFNCMYGLS